MRQPTRANASELDAYAAWDHGMQGVLTKLKIVNTRETHSAVAPESPKALKSLKAANALRALKVH